MGFIRSAKALQDNLLSNVLRWPMHMFDTTPVGRLLNRFSKGLKEYKHLLSIVLNESIV